MKVSEIESDQVAEYLRLDDYQDEDIEPMLESAKAFIRSYTGLTDEEIDTHEDFYIVVMVLCQDMYDNRCMYVDKSNLNKVVETILGMHCVNLL
jgi:hypothetical protein